MSGVSGGGIFLDASNATHLLHLQLLGGADKSEKSVISLCPRVVTGPWPHVNPLSHFTA